MVDLNEGVINALLTDANKIICDHCQGTTFQIGFQMDENINLPSHTKAYAWEDSDPTNIQGNMYTAVLLCQCGQITGKLVFCLDVCLARGSNSITGTAIKAAVANSLVGLYITLLGGDDVGTQYEITANSLADPTVMTIVGTPAANTATELILLSSFKNF